MERLNKKTGKKLNTVQYQSLDTINLSKVSERRYQDLFNNASDAIFIRDLKGNIIEVNEGAVTLTGYTHNELTGMNASEFLTAESFKLIMKKQKALLEDEAANQRYELEIIRKDGVRLSAESRTSLLTHNGRPIGVQGIVRDITERKQMEEALRFLSSVLEQAKDSIIVTNHNYEIEYVNKATEELYGYSQEELVGLTPLILNAEPMAEDIQRDIYKTVSSGEVMTGTVLNKRKDGSTFVCDFKVSPLSDKDGRVLGYIGIQRDITEQRRMEEALQASEERFRNIYEESPIGIELYDCDARLLTVNRACLDIFGVSNIAEVQGFKLFDDLNITDEVKQRLRKRETVRYEALFDFEKVKKHKLYNTSKSGTIHLNVLITPLGERREKRLGGYLIQVQDITEHKQVEKALRESEERYRTVADFTYDWEYWIDSDGDLRYISPSCERMTGYRVDEFLRDPKLLDRIIHPDDYPVIAQHINGEFKSKEALHVDFRITSRSGEERWIAHWCQPVYDNDGSWLGRRGSNRDITQRKRAEEELRIAEQNFRNSLDSSPLGIRIVTDEGELLYANQAILDIYGYSTVEELKNVPTKQRYTPESYTEYQMRKAKRKQGEPVPADYEISIVRKDGEVRHLAVFRKEVIWGNEIQFQTLYQDITGHKRVEEELRIAEQNFRNSLNSSPLGIRIVTAEGELLYANQAMLDIYGYSSVEELKSVPTKQRYTPKSYAEHQMRKAKRKQGKPVPSNYEVSIVRKDGEVRHLAVFRKEVIWGGKTQFQALFQDITEQKRVEVALRQSEEFNSSLLTNSPNPILVLNADASIMYVNPALEKLTGFPSAELIGSKPPYPWWIKETHKELSRRLAQAMRRDTRKYEAMYRKKNGERFWVEKIFKTVKVNGEFKYYLANWVDLTEQKRLKANMEFYLAEVTRAQEEERKRISREIHDDSIQSLATLALDIDAMVREKERLPEDVIRRLKGLRAETNGILDGLRRFSHELRPGVIDHVGLVPALEILTEELNKENRVKSSLEIRGSERRLMPETELALFRIAQEALRNVRRHSRATKATIRLKFTRSRVKLTVSDNGGGFEPPDTLSDFAAEGKLGLIGMQERARLLNGKLLVKSRAGRGTTVVVDVADIQGMKG